MLTTIYGRFASQIWHFSLAESGFCNIQRLQVQGPPLEEPEGLGGAEPNANPVDGFCAGRRASHTVHFSLAESGFLSIHVSHVQSPPETGAFMVLNNGLPNDEDPAGVLNG